MYSLITDEPAGVSPDYLLARAEERFLASHPELIGQDFTAEYFEDDDVVVVKCGGYVTVYTAGGLV